MEINKHAASRMKQRGITTNLIETLISIGKTQYHKGCKIISINKDALKKLPPDQVTPSLIQKLKKLYVVIHLDSQVIITTAYRNQRLKNDRKIHQCRKRKKRAWRKSLMVERLR